MIKLLEAIFRHYILLLIMLFLPIIIGIVVGYILPPTYQASTTLWALERFSVIGATGPESDLQSTPAVTQASALTELLQSRTFDISIGKSTDLKSTLKLSAQTLANPRLLGDAYVADISKNVQVTPNGTNLYQITYTNSDPRVAAQVLKALVTQFQSQGEQFSVIQGQYLLAQDQAQLTKIQADANNAVSNESTYLANHPGSTPTNDPQLALLDGERQQAQAVLQNMQTTIASLQQDIATQNAGGGAFFKTLDPPVQPDTAVSRSKTLLTTGGIGAAIALVVCILYILIVVRRDRGLYTALDVKRATSYPILMQTPHLTPKAKELVISGVGK